MYAQLRYTTSPQEQHWSMSSTCSSSTGGAVTGVGSLSRGLKVGGTGVEGSRVHETGGTLSSVTIRDVTSGVSFVRFTFDSGLELMMGMRAPWTSL